MTKSGVPDDLATFTEDILNRKAIFFAMYLLPRISELN